MLEIKEIVFVDRFENKDTSSLLNEILRKTEIFVRFNDSYPKKVKMTYNQYKEILKNRPSVIKCIEEDYEKNYYILRMKIIL